MWALCVGEADGGLRISYFLGLHGLRVSDGRNGGGGVLWLVAPRRLGVLLDERNFVRHYLVIGDVGHVGHVGHLGHLGHLRQLGDVWHIRHERWWDVCRRRHTRSGAEQRSFAGQCPCAGPLWLALTHRQGRVLDL